jgi:hypothetical protein
MRRSFMRRSIYNEKRIEFMVLTLSKVIVYGIFIASMVQPAIASDMQLKISAGPFSKEIPCTIYSADSNEVNLNIVGSTFFQTYGSDTHWVATESALHSLLASLHQKKVDLRPMENLCYNHPLKLHKNFSYNKQFGTIASPDRMPVRCSEWPKLEHGACMTVLSHVDLTENTDLAVAYIGITERLFLDKPVLDIDSLSAAMSLMRAEQEVVVDDVKKMKLKIPRERVQNKIAPARGIVKSHHTVASQVSAKNEVTSVKTDRRGTRPMYGELFRHGLITDEIWYRVASHLKKGTRLQMVIEDRDCLEAICKYELGLFNWTSLAKEYAVNEKILYQKWIRWRRIYPDLVFLVSNVVEQNRGILVGISDALITNSAWRNMASTLYENTERTSPVGNRVILELVCQKIIHNSRWIDVNKKLAAMGVTAGKGFLSSKWASWKTNPEVVKVVEEVCQKYKEGR